MTTQKQEVAPIPVNLKQKNASHSFRIIVRDRVHFYKVVKWLNENVGKGQDHWTMGGRVLRQLAKGISVDTMIYIFHEDFEKESALYLSLI